MKIFSPTRNDFKKYLILPLFGLVAFTSCKKQTEDTTAYSAITVINASTTVSTYDIFLNDSKLNNAAIPFGGTVSYTKHVAGNYNLKFTTAGRTDALLDKVITLSPFVNHSYFLIGNAGALDGLLIQDNLSTANTTSAAIRFINLSPDAPALDLYINGGAVVSTDKAYKAVGSFATLAPGEYNFELRNSAGTVLGTPTGKITVKAGINYTIIARGLVTPGALQNPLSAHVIQY